MVAKNNIKNSTYWPAIRIVIIMLVVTGIAYPLLVVVIGQGLLPSQSNGTLIKSSEGRVIGSSLIGQDFKSPKFFHTRNQSDTASGVDPDITPESAYSQVANVSKATGIPENQLKTMVELRIEKSKTENLVGFAPDYVNVFDLNLELERQYPGAYSEFLHSSSAINSNISNDTIVR